MIRFLIITIFLIPSHIFYFSRAEELMNYGKETNTESNIVNNKKKLIADSKKIIKNISNLELENRYKEAIKEAKYLLDRLKKEDPEYELGHIYYYAYHYLGYLNFRTGNLNEAEKFFLSIKELVRNLFGKTNDFYISNNLELASVYKDKGLYIKAKKLVEESINIIKEVYGKKSLFLISPLNQQATIDFELGQYENGKNILLKALEIIDKENNDIKNITSRFGSLKFTKRDYGVTLSNLGYFYSIKGNFNKSEKFYQDALKFIGKDNLITYTIILSNISNNYLNLGLLSKAEKYLLQSLEINKINGFQPEFANDLQSLGTVYKEQRLWEKSEEYFLKSLQIQEEYFGKKNINTTSILNQIANLYSIKEEYEKAKKIYLEILEIQKKFLPPYHPDMAITLNNIGYIYINEKEFKKAENIFLEALKNDQKKFGEIHPRVATLKLNLGQIYFRQGFFAKAEDYFKEALKDNEKIFGQQNPELQNNLDSLVHVYYQMGNFQLANKYFKRAAVNSYNYIFQELPFLIDSERDNLRNFGMGNYIFHYSKNNKLMAENALLTRINRYGVLENLERLQYEIMRSASDKIRDLKNKRNKLIKKISNINLTEKQKINLENEKNKIEKKLINSLQSFEYTFTELKDVAVGLNNDEILIEFTRYYPYKESSLSYDINNPQYLAFTLNSNSEIKVFDLGSAFNIEDKIDDAYKAIKDNEANIEFLLDKVSKLVFDASLKNYIKDYKTIYVSADYKLQKIPITLLRDPISKKYLSDYQNFILVNGGKDLISNNLSKSSKSNSVIVSNPNYSNLKNLVKLNNSSFGNIKSNLRSKQLLSRNWEYREGFEKEGKEIERILDGDLITWNFATTDAVLKIKSPKILHIITHGFYFPKTEASEKALTRSGIVLAGANDANILEDGYLTALEMSTIDLEGTELVTISACESGEGDLRPYESLNGLRRSLFIAGAKSTLLSLWKVDDEATTEFMIDFYKNLKKGMHKNKALSLTQKNFRDGIIKSKSGDDWTDWTNIFYWGAFQISGDMSPIKF